MLPRPPVVVFKCHDVVEKKMMKVVGFLLRCLSSFYFFLFLSCCDGRDGLMSHFIPSLPFGSCHHSSANCVLVMMMIIIIIIIIMIMMLCHDTI